MTRATIAGMVGRKPGPAPLPASEKRSEAVALVKCTPREREILEAWAERKRTPLAVLLREAGLRAAKRS